MMNVYSINWNIFSDNQLMGKLRKPKIRSFAKILLHPMKLLHLDFLNFRQKCLYRIQHNSQICYMEAMLNDLFDPSLRRIRIVNVTFLEPIYFYEPEENRDVYFYEPEEGRDVYFREEEDFAGDGVDFLVCVPPDLQPQTEAATMAYITRMSGEVEYYKLYSKNFKIVWDQING
jgi:hypothetical protein